MSRPRTTGYRSENNHCFGHARDIALQLELDSSEIMSVLYAVLAMPECPGDAWPVVDGGLKPWSEATGEDADLAIKRMHWFADHFGLWLTEYLDGRAQRVYFGGVQ